MENKKNESVSKGFILAGFEKILYWTASKTSVILGFYLFKDYPQRDFSDDYIRKSNNRVDLFNVLFWIIAALSYFIMLRFTGFITVVFLIIVVVRIINIVAYNLFNIFANNNNVVNNRTIAQIVNARRSLLYAIINYIELIILFASIYAKFSSHINIVSSQADSLVYLYFSNISQLTIGYGDIVPKDFIRFVVSIQGMIGLLLVALTIGKLVGMIPMGELRPSSSEIGDSQ